eukprot:CAMPEP_0168616690 /NCGR_PEP_ID=MMETSP0449_2-20121227/5154_1 /TAXON_ID=1082188 /ORGANISM="Strombidium rassoulzadegani, Strain ras09" /LENGTH=208 /DNA_ID=CAMNT_0008657477 /DNA_START=408 /DNA_END=1033 /DNA_ORIENTATION=+
MNSGVHRESSWLQFLLYSEMPQGFLTMYIQCWTTPWSSKSSKTEMVVVLVSLGEAALVHQLVGAPIGREPDQVVEGVPILHHQVATVLSGIQSLVEEDGAAHHGPDAVVEEAAFRVRVGALDLGPGLLDERSPEGVIVAAWLRKHRPVLLSVVENGVVEGHDPRFAPDEEADGVDACTVHLVGQEDGSQELGKLGHCSHGSDNVAVCD